MKSPTKFVFTTVAALTLGLLTACGGSSSSSTSTPTKSTLTLNITDAPVDSAAEVFVEFTGVELKKDGGAATSIDFSEPKQIDLLTLQNGDASALLSDIEIEPGVYQWVRLKVNAERSTMDSYISLDDGNTFSLFVPSGSQNGLKLVSGFTIPVGKNASFTIDFDLRKSVVNPVGLVDDYILKPVMRMVDNNEIGSVVGTVDNSLVEVEACQTETGEYSSVVYLYEGADVTADDVGSATAPLSSINVMYDAQNNSYGYTAAYLSPSDYTLALTCDAANDDPEADDDLTFISSINANVEANQTTTADFSQ